MAMLSRSPLEIDDFMERATQNRVAFVSIDHQYMFQNLNMDCYPAAFDSYNQNYQLAIDMMRQASIPVIHVAYDIDSDETISLLDRDQRKMLFAHSREFLYNAAEMVISKQDDEQAYVIHSDMLHTVLPGEILYMKPCINAFDNNSKLDDYLKAQGIDSLIFAGMYLTDCAISSMIGGVGHGYDVAAIADLLEGQKPIPSTKRRFENNKSYIANRLPPAAITQTAELAEILRSPLAHKLAA